MESAQVVPSPSGVLSIVLAGGRGSRLHDLTDCEAKPALPIGPDLRLIDFTLANIVNSGLQKAMVLTQHAPSTLQAHLARWVSDSTPCGFTVLDGSDHGPFAGTAHAVASVMDQIEREAPEHVVVLAGDHLYQMDYRPLVQRHVDRAASVTVGVVHVPVPQASEFGILAADASGRITAFVEKPRIAPEAGDLPGRALASMGIYVFDWKVLRPLLATMAKAVTDLDFGRHIVPHLVAAGNAFAYALPGRGEEEPLWQDLGTLDAYHAVQMKLAAGALVLDPKWPVVSLADNRQSTFGGGSLLRGVAVLPGARIGRWVSISNAIVTGDAVIPDGFDLNETIADFGNWCIVSPGGIRLISAQALKHLAALRHKYTILPERSSLRSLGEIPVPAVVPALPAV
ncbi:sugar phosphate nucleotidyltransferase (plasmid) [Novosphingobium sp. BL-8A]|uniref:glucose-1-phosphate adenylyltransferase family protein n=1 Tax=Novosphingobium sp. BL-8A TaxID=3127639 RepID=UPI0037576A25